MYCVYLTTYKGNKMPKWYIGSSSLSKLENGYHGSVTSKAYKIIWRKELKDNSHLFKTDIIKIYNTREEALQGEYEYQVGCDVVKSKEYINMSFSIPKGFFGRDVKGIKNPRYGYKYTEEELKLCSGNNNPNFGKRGILNPLFGKKRPKEVCKKMSESGKLKIFTDTHRKSLSESQKGRKHTSETIQKIINSNRGKKQSDYAKKRASEVHKNKIISEETKERMRISRLEYLKRKNNSKKELSC